MTDTGDAASVLMMCIVVYSPHLLLIETCFSKTKVLPKSPDHHGRVLTVHSEISKNEN